VLEVCFLQEITAALDNLGDHFNLKELMSAVRCIKKTGFFTKAMRIFFE